MPPFRSEVSDIWLCRLGGFSDLLFGEFAFTCPLRELLVLSVGITDELVPS